MVNIERNVTIEPDRDTESAFTTFAPAAPVMPTFSDKELKDGNNGSWQDEIADLFQRVEARVHESSADSDE
jgi:hypothetical protein